jgi:hypothetical protein
VNPADLVSPARDLLSGRFLLVSYVPTAAATVFLKTLLWAGAPGPVSFRVAWRTAAGLGTADVLLVLLGVLTVAVVVAPLQLALVRVLEGGWPGWLGAGGARRLQRRRWHALRAAARVGTAEDGSVSPAELQRAGVAGTRLWHRFASAEHLLRPTALGNVLAAMEDRAGRRYGLEAVVVWPRLYPVLDGATRAIVDDRRNLVDATARLSATAAVTALVSVPLLARSGPWLLLVAALLGVALLAYHATVQAALAYAAAVEAAFDLCRFRLYEALHLPLPENSRIERANNEALCDAWRQDVPVQLTYAHRPDQVPDDGR